MATCWLRQLRFGQVGIGRVGRLGGVGGRPQQLGQVALAELIEPGRVVPVPGPQFETGAGGAVFSVGSIAWCGALREVGSETPVGRMTWNVLPRFADPAPFGVTASEQIPEH